MLVSIDLSREVPRSIVGPPQSGDEDEVRFALTSEAGLNDAAAFPIAVVLYAVSGAPFFQHWLLVDVILKIAVGGGLAG